MRLPNLLGSARLKEALAPLLPGELGQAVLLDGPRGVGKHTAARDLSMALLCQKGAMAPCGVCPACRRVLAGSHPDLFWLEEPEGGKGVKLEQVRALRAQSFIRPSEAPYKVFVLPQADKLNLPSQNALLKVLEEPASSIFILLCENREAMLQTVRSRCKTFRLTPLSQEEIRRALTARVPDPAVSLDTAAAQAGGCLGRALEIAQGQESPGAAAARSFVSALGKPELTVFRACQEAGRLSREDYGTFCDESCRLLAEAAARQGESRFIDTFEYLETQRAMLLQNPSVTALAGALVAFCGARWEVL